MSFDLTGRKISETYQRIVQYDSGSLLLYDGIGNKVAVSGSTLSAISSSFAEAAISSSYAPAEPIFSESISSRITTLNGASATTGSNIFIGNQTITGTLTVTGSIIRSIKTITDNYTVTTNDKIILANTYQAFSASLTTPVDGESIIFKVIGNFPFTIQPQTGATIDDNDNLIVTDKFVSVELIASASNWYII